MFQNLGFFQILGSNGEHTVCVVTERAPFGTQEQHHVIKLINIYAEK